MPVIQPHPGEAGRHPPPGLIFERLALLGAFLLPMLGACHPHPVATLALLGDLMLGRDENPTQGSLTILTPALSSADLVLANLESPLAPVPSTSNIGYNLCAPSTRASLLAGWGIDLVSIANNHALDCGPDGPASTRSALASAGIASIGPGMQPLSRRVNGLSLVFLAFDDVTSPLDETAAVQAIRSARATGSEVVVSVHWGMEYQGGASDRQKSLAQEFAEAGAALVWGHHPHVLQPAAWVGSSLGKTLVLYSLGNALFDQGGLEDTRRSALILVTLDDSGVTDSRAVPFLIDVPNSSLVQPDEATSKQILQWIGLPGSN